MRHKDKFLSNVSSQYRVSVHSCFGDCVCALLCVCLGDRIRLCDAVVLCRGLHKPNPIRKRINNLGFVCLCVMDVCVLHIEIHTFHIA